MFIFVQLRLVHLKCNKFISKWLEVTAVELAFHSPINYMQAIYAFSFRTANHCSIFLILYLYQNNASKYIGDEASSDPRLIYDSTHPQFSVSGTVEYLFFGPQ
ncbi:hypothetical protein A4A49_07989 [Nicotiana attenuata]|uniref:Uncharacterized protein n=1 Tax=Nicotiana attenuata TaxID=49451 RepID=A0A314KU35_NICAT|nr:hypothetical protein A4A49_07989 [Nicotiana attenuata]